MAHSCTHLVRVNSRPANLWTEADWPSSTSPRLSPCLISSCPTPSSAPHPTLTAPPTSSVTPPVEKPTQAAPACCLVCEQHSVCLSLVSVRSPEPPAGTHRDVTTTLACEWEIRDWTRSTGEVRDKWWITNTADANTCVRVYVRMCVHACVH